MTIDYLFDHDLTEKYKIINEYCQQYDAHNNEQKPSQERVDMMRKALAEFPAEEELLVRLAVALFNKWCNHGNYTNIVDGYIVWDYEKQKSYDGWEEAIMIMEEILSTSLDDSIRRRCRKYLVYIYGRIGEKDKLLNISEKCDPISYSKQVILADIMDGKDGIMYTQEELLILLSEFYHRFGRIARFYIKDSNVIIGAYNILINLYKFIFSDGNYGYYNFDMLELYRVHSYELIKQSRIDEAFDMLENAYNHTTMFDKYLSNTEHKYTAPYVDLIVSKSGTAYTVKQMPEFLNLLKDENGFFKQIQGDVRYTTLINKMEVNI